MLPVVSLKAQNNKFDFGLETGPSLGFGRGNPAFQGYSFPHRFGFSGGLFAQYNFPKIFSIRMDVLFARKGTIYERGFIDSQGNVIATSPAYCNYNYLMIPVLGHLHFGKKLQFFVNAGPYLGYLIQETEKTTLLLGNTSSRNAKYTVSKNTGNYKREDIGFVAGIGLGIPVGAKVMFTAEVRNNLGLTNINQIETKTLSYLPLPFRGAIRLNSTSLLLGLGYRFGMRNN